jgi:hypothetical protein
MCGYTSYQQYVIQHQLIGLPPVEKFGQDVAELAKILVLAF